MLRILFLSLKLKVKIIYFTYVIVVNAAGQFSIVTNTGNNNFTAYSNLPFPMGAYMSGIASNSSVLLIDVLDSMPQSMMVPGTKIYTGYGTSAEEMVNAGRYRMIYSF